MQTSTVLDEGQLDIYDQELVSNTQNQKGKETPNDNRNHNKAGENYKKMNKIYLIQECLTPVVYRL